MEHIIPVTFPKDEAFDIGQDTPFKFTGKIDKLTFKLEPEEAIKP